jgi:hypothetical protein
MDYFYKKKPTAPPPPNPLEKIFLNKTMEEPRFNPSKEWLEEVKHSFEVLQIMSPPTSITCLIRSVVEALRDPIVEANIMSEYLADTLLITCL